MRRELRSVRSVAREIADAVEGAMDAYREQRVVDEPHLTDRILGSIEERLRTANISGIAWRAKTLRTGRGAAAEEKRHGADVMGVLDIAVPQLRVKKGFLAQAKRAEPGEDFSGTEWDRLVDQCGKMLSRTPDSFVFLYSRRRGLRIVPATAVVGFDGHDPFELYHRSVAPFFEDFIECFIGDPRLHTPDIATLDSLLDIPAKNVLYLTARKQEEIA